MELRHLRYFIAVAEELHFRHAAEIVHVGQPAVSQRIRELEEEVGVRLFERSHHKVVLTPAGKAFYENVQNILKQTDHAVAVARKVNKGEAGTIRIGFVSTAAITVLAAALKRLQTDVPSAEIELKEHTPAEQIDALFRKQLDIGFLRAKLNADGLSTLVVYSDQLIAAVPASCKLAAKSTVHLKDLISWPAIMPEPHSPSGLYEHVRRVYEKAGVAPERVYHTRLLPTGLLLVAAGIGISLVPESFKSINVKGVVYKKLAIEPPRFELVAAWRTDNMSMLLRRFIEYLQARS